MYTSTPKPVRIHNPNKPINKLKPDHYVLDKSNKPTRKQGRADKRQTYDGYAI